jgi:hypothetical protein
LLVHHLSLLISLVLYFFFLSWLHLFYYCKLANTNYTQTRDRNSTKWNDGKTKKGWNTLFILTPWK